MRIKREWAKIKDRKMAGEHVIVRQGSLGRDITNIVQLNDSGLFLWRSLADREFEVADVAALLAGEYGIDEDTAAKDAAAWVELMRKNDLTDE